YDVKLEADGSPYLRWNPPSLRGLWQRGPYLHDGRAATLDELLQGPHASEKLGGQALTPAHRQDLIAFLQSLWTHETGHPSARRRRTPDPHRGGSRRHDGPQRRR